MAAKWFVWNYFSGSPARSQLTDAQKSVLQLASSLAVMAGWSRPCKFSISPRPGTETRLVGNTFLSRECQKSLEKVTAQCWVPVPEDLAITQIQLSRELAIAKAGKAAGDSLQRQPWHQGEGAEWPWESWWKVSPFGLSCTGGQTAELPVRVKQFSIPCSNNINPISLPLCLFLLMPNLNNLTFFGSRKLHN